MNGKIAVLYQGGKQVGGLFDWQIDMILPPSIKNGWREYKLIKEITARSYWLIDAPDGNLFEVKFYNAIRGHLVLIATGMVEVNLPKIIVNKKIFMPLKLRWIY